MKILIYILSVLSRFILKRYRPELIGITGSVGKTSAKRAICTVLSRRFRVRGSIKSYNNEIGVPLTIIGADSANRSIVGWAAVIWRAVRLIFWRDLSYPEILVLEMGADRPGDITYLTSLASCNVGVLTAIARAHLERFETLENIAAEKRVIITHLKPGTTAIINSDDELVARTVIPDGVKCLTYGLLKSADVRGSEVALSHEPGAAGITTLRGISFKVSYRGSTVPVLLPGAIGTPAVLAALAAAAIGISYGLNLLEISNSLQSYKTPPGRLRLIPGANGTHIIDDSYNCSPSAALIAIDILAELPHSPSAKRYFVLGDMLELGTYSKEAHETIGRHLAERLGEGILVTVGERVRISARAARLAGLDPTRIFCFAETDEAGRFLKDHLNSGDIVLVKGSQAMRLERIVKKLIAEPERASELLVRQGPEWQE